MSKRSCHKEVTPSKSANGHVLSYTDCGDQHYREGELAVKTPL